MELLSLTISVDDTKDGYSEMIVGAIAVPKREKELVAACVRATTVLQLILDKAKTKLTLEEYAEAFMVGLRNPGSSLQTSIPIGTTVQQAMGMMEKRKTNPPNDN